MDTTNAAAIPDSAPMAIPAYEIPNYAGEEEPPPPPPSKKKKLTKAEKKERKLQAQIEFRRLELQHSLRLELELSKKSERRGRDLWDEMCKTIKMKEFYEELRTWNQNTERIFKEKDELVVRIIDDMEATKALHKRNYSKQIEVIDYLTKAYKIMVDSIKKMYSGEIEAVVEEFFSGIRFLKKQDLHRRHNCERVQHALNVYLEKGLDRNHELFLVRRDQQVNTEIANRYQIRDRISKTITDVQTKLKNYMINLINLSKDNGKFEQTQNLLRRQRGFEKEGNRYSSLERKYTRRLSEMQRELVLLEVEAARKINDLKLELLYFVQVRKSIESGMQKDRTITHQKLRVLAFQSYNFSKGLKEMAKRGDLLLSLTATCRQLETESEKIVHYNKRPMTDTELYNRIKLNVINIKQLLDLSEEDMYHQMKIMQNFWRRQCVVEFHNAKLTLDKQHLIKENKQFIKFIKSLSKTTDESDLLALLTVKSAMDYTCVDCPGVLLEQKPQYQPFVFKISKKERMSILGAPAQKDDSESSEKSYVPVHQHEAPPEPVKALVSVDQIPKGRKFSISEQAPNIIEISSNLIIKPHGARDSVTAMDEEATHKAPRSILRKSSQTDSISSKKSTEHDKLHGILRKPTIENDSIHGSKGSASDKSSLLHRKITSLVDPKDSVGVTEIHLAKDIKIDKPINVKEEENELEMALIDDSDSEEDLESEDDEFDDDILCEIR